MKIIFLFEDFIEKQVIQRNKYKKLNFNKFIKLIL